MRSPNAAREESDDLFAHTRMSFGDHIEELRLRLIRALVGFLAALVVGLVVGQPVLDWIQKPARDQLIAFHRKRIEKERKQLVEQEQKTLDIAQTLSDQDSPHYSILLTFAGETEFDPVDQRIIERKEAPRRAEMVIPANVAKKLALDAKANEDLVLHAASLISLTPMEVFFTYMQVSIYCGIVLASPWIFYQLWMFVGAGLYPHEKRYVYTYLPLSIGLFLGGVALSEFVALPKAVESLLWFNDWMGVEPEYRLGDWLSFAIMVPLIFGVAFQTPLVMFFLERFGIVQVELYTKNRRMAIFVLAVAAAILAPSGDPISMMMLAIPLWVLYEAGILMCRFVPKPKEEIEAPDPEEMVEV